MSEGSEVLDLMGRTVEVQVEIPAGSRRKLRADGSLDFIAPLPCPWAYGSLPGTTGGDGDPLDALLVDHRPPRGARVPSTVQGVVHFIDAGARDDKLICADDQPGPAIRVAILCFFRAYCVAKRVLQRARGQRGATRVDGIRWRTAPVEPVLR